MLNSHYFEVSVIDDFRKIWFIELVSFANTRIEAEEAIRELIILLLQAKQEKYKISVVSENKRGMSPSDSVATMFSELEEKSRGRF